MLIYIDMDGVLCDIASAYAWANDTHPHIEFPQSIPGIFLGMSPIIDSIETVNWLRGIADVWILSAPSVRNPHCYSEKRQWVEKHFDYAMAKRLILATDKSLLRGDILIDDNLFSKGQDRFDGELILFGSNKFPNWATVKDVLQSRLD